MLAAKQYGIPPASNAAPVAAAMRSNYKLGSAAAVDGRMCEDALFSGSSFVRQKQFQLIGGFQNGGRARLQCRPRN